jgi:hypothetical protein
VYPQISILFIGHSHVDCIAAAIRDNAVTTAHVVNINTALKANSQKYRGIISRLLKRENRIHRAIITAVVRAAPVKDPDAICLCIGGNDHNVLGLLENPIPFSVGDAQAGSAPPDDPDRHFIPYHLIQEYFENRLLLDLIEDLYDLFPAARKFYLNPPPPISDWKHIKSHPGVFRSKLGAGPAPAPLRLQLYRVQTEVLRKKAGLCGAVFIEAAPDLLNPQGFLSPEYYNADPTHGNAAYGQAMLNDISGRL